MAEIYEKIPGVDKALILNPRQAVQRRLADAIVDNWSEIRVGAFWSVTTAAQDNEIPVGTEDVTRNSLLDVPFFGLKNWYDIGQTSGAPNEIAPGFTGSLFIGKGWTSPIGSTTTLQKVGTTNWMIQGNPYWLSAGYYNDTDTSGFAGVGNPVQCPYDISADTLYAGLMSFKLTIANRGLSNQTLTVWATNTPWEQSAYTDVSANNLRAVLSQALYVNTMTYTWNDGISAYPVPDAFYVRMPFFANRIRLHCVGILRIS